MGARGHQVLLCTLLLTADDQLGLKFLVRRVCDYPARQAGDFVHFFAQCYPLLKVLELNRTADFCQDRESVRVPLHDDVAYLRRRAIRYLDLSAVNHRMALALPTSLVNHHHRSVAVHGYEVSVAVLDRLQVVIPQDAIVPGFQRRLLADPAGGTTDVEGPHRELRAGLADGLSGYDAHRLAHLYHAAGGEVPSVAAHADTASRLAGQHRANLHPFDTRRLDGRRQVFVNFLVYVHDDVALVVFDLLQRNTTHDTITQGLYDFAGLDDGLHINAIHRATIELGDDHVLSNVHQPPGQVTGVGGLERRIRQALARAMSGDKVLQNVQAFAEVRGDRSLDDLTRRLGHQAPHS